MKFIDYRSMADHYSFVLTNDLHNSDVVYVPSINYLIRSKVLQFLYRVHHSKLNNYIKLPFKRLWYHYYIPKECRNYKGDLCFIVQPSVIIDNGDGFVDYLHSKYKCKVALVLGDRMGIYPSTFDIEHLKGVVDLVCTYNPVDSEKYNLSLHPSMVYNLNIQGEIPFKDREIDVFYIGQDKGRGEEIVNAFVLCNKLGLKCEFIIVGKTLSPKIEGISYVGWMSYMDVFERLKHTKCILNILQPGATGITLRDTEAYNLGCFLLTNSNLNDSKEIFNDGQVIQLNALNHNTADLIIKKEEAFPRKVNRFNMDCFYNWIENEVQS